VEVCNATATIRIVTGIAFARRAFRLFCESSQKSGKSGELIRAAA
jgi:hypothetical protein